MRDIFGSRDMRVRQMLHHADGGGGERQSDDSREEARTKHSVINCRKSWPRPAPRATRTESRRMRPRFAPAAGWQTVAAGDEQHAQDSGEGRSRGVLRSPASHARNETAKAPTP